MLNLLNREKRYILRGEYFSRLLNVFLGILIFCLVYYGILLFSNSFLVNFEKSAVENESQNLLTSKSQKELNEYEQKLKHLQAEYNLFAKNMIYPKIFLNEITGKQIEGISLNSINFQKTDQEGVIKLDVRGVAKNRDILIRYSNSLKTDKIFKDVTIPVSSFARNTDIPFSLSVSAKIDQKNEN